MTVTLMRKDFTDESMGFWDTLIDNAIDAKQLVWREDIHTDEDLSIIVRVVAVVE
jgi:hypothetical protein